MSDADVTRLTPAAQASHPAGALTSIALALWWLALVVSPIYLFEPGTPQLSDAVMAGALAILLVARPTIDKDLMLLGGLWLGYVAVVNMSWWSIIQDDRFLWSIIYYLYNFAMMCAIVSWLSTRPDQFIRYTRVALLVALGLQVCLVAILSTTAPRAAGMFDNPNQLGYWALLVGAAWFLLKPREPLHLVDLGALFASVFCSFQSASRAGLGGAVILVIVVFFFYGIRKRHIPLVLLSAATMTLVAVAWSDHWLPGITEHTAIDRLDREGPHDSFAARGYDRIWLYPEYLLLGSGQGAYERFAELSAGASNEIHSTFATLLFSYGLLGTALFCFFLWQVFRGSEWQRIALFAPLAFYGLTHMGLRSTLLWVCLGLVVGIRRLRTRACGDAH